MNEIEVKPNYLNAYRKGAKLPIWKVKRILETRYSVVLSEGKLSRILGGIDSISPEIETALRDLFQIDEEKE